MSELFGIKKVGPNRYREDPGRYFEDFNVGDIYEHWPGRTEQTHKGLRYVRC